jgi:hypothetical protein
MHVCCTIQVRRRSISLTTAASFCREWVEVPSLKMFVLCSRFASRARKYFLQQDSQSWDGSNTPIGSGVPPFKHE